MDGWMSLGAPQTRQTASELLKQWCSHWVAPYSFSLAATLPVSRVFVFPYFTLKPLFAVSCIVCPARDCSHLWSPCPLLVNNPCLPLSWSDSCCSVRVTGFLSGFVWFLLVSPEIFGLVFFPPVADPLPPHRLHLDETALCSNSKAYKILGCLSAGSCGGKKC